MADKTGKTWMAIGETDDLNAVIESFEAEAAVTKGDPVYLSADDKVSPAAAAQDCIGIAVKDAALGAQCSVLKSGRVKVKAGGVIARGKAVYGADASKRILVLADQDVAEGAITRVNPADMENHQLVVLSNQLKELIKHETTG